MSFLYRLFVAVLVCLAGFSGGVKSLSINTAQAAAPESKGKDGSGGSSGGCASRPVQSSTIQN